MGSRCWVPAFAGRSGYDGRIKQKGPTLLPDLCEQIKMLGRIQGST
jgi:hypothetical protein